MKILDFGNIKAYDFLRASLTALEGGDLEGAILHALYALKDSKRTTLERIDVALYIAKMYSEMGEYRACACLLFRTLRYGVAEGRIYGLLAYNFYRAGDDTNGDYYNALLDEWNRVHGDTLEPIALKRTSHTSAVCSEDKSYSDSVKGIIDRAWHMALAGDSARARELILSLDERQSYKKYELLATLDVVEGADRRDTEHLYSIIMNTPINEIDIMNLFYLFDRTGNMRGIIDLARKAIDEGKCTLRLAEIYATALLNVGEQDVARRILKRIDALFGDVMPDIRALTYVAEHNRDVNRRIYNARYVANEYGLMRDAGLMNLVRGKSIADIVSNDDIVALIHSMYNEGVVTMATESITALLMRSKQGRHLLEDVLLDIGMTSATMRVYIVRHLIETESRVKVVYDNIYNDVEVKIPKGMSDSERYEYKNKYAYWVVSGEV